MSKHRNFDSESYVSLLTQYQPKVIETELENKQAIAIVEKLESRPNLTLEENALLELLVTLIEKFEQEQYSSLVEVTPYSMLMHLMHSKDIKQEALVGVIGSKSVVSEIFNGKISISQAQAEALGKLFQVAPNLFL